MTRPRLALVPGEPAGVGPELCVHAAHHAWDADLVVIGDRDTLLRAATVLDLPIRFLSPDAAEAACGELRLIDLPNAALPAFGAPDPRNARAVVDALLQAADGCGDGRFHGMVTGPVHKAAINAAASGTTSLQTALAPACEAWAASHSRARRKRPATSPSRERRSSSNTSR